MLRAGVLLIEERIGEAPQETARPELQDTSR
jgi:hypothetical protein